MLSIQAGNAAASIQECKYLENKGMILDHNCISRSQWETTVLLSAKEKYLGEENNKKLSWWSISVLLVCEKIMVELKFYTSAELLIGADVRHWYVLEFTLAGFAEIME